MRHLLPAAVFAITMLSATSAHADVRVSGDATALRVDANQVQVADVLSALRATVDVRVSAQVVLDRPISGSYAGSLGQVLARVLEGYNYVVKARDGQTEIVVLGRRGDQAVAPRPVTPPAAPRSLAAEWRTPPGKAPAPRP